MRISLSSELVRAEISLLGAELVRLSAGGYDLLWNGDPSIWTGHAPILFPIVGMLNKGRYRLDDSTFDMPKHGFARKSEFSVIEHAEGHAVLRITANALTRAIYPFEFELDLIFDVAGAALRVTGRVKNLDERAMPVSFGFHPAFRWPLPFGASRNAHRVIFAIDETAPIRRINAHGLLETKARPSPIDGRTLWLRDDLFVDDALIFDQLRSRALDYGAEGIPSVALDFTDFPDLGIWTKPNADFICLEPWQGYNDPEGFDGDIWAKPGIVSIKPAESRDFSLTISIEGL